MKKLSILFKTRKRPFKVNWTEEEDKILFSYRCSDKKKSWKAISNLLNNKTPSQCYYRYFRMNSPQSKKKFTLEDDKIIKEFVKSHGRKWQEIANLLKFSSAKQIKERFINKLDESLIHSKFTKEEDQMIISFYMKYGSRWSLISRNFPGRTPNMLKSRFYSNLHKRIALENCKKNIKNYFVANEKRELLIDKVNILCEDFLFI